MAYADITLTEAEDQLARMLADSAKVRFISDELQTYLIEAIRTWNALSNIYEDQSDPITVAANTVFLDLPTVAPAMLGYTVLSTDLLGPIEYHLIEPKQIRTWTGTEMFTLDELADAITRRRDQFLLDTLCRVTRAQLPASPNLIYAGTDHYQLPDTTIGVRRAAWVDANTLRTYPLWLTSHWSIRSSPAGLNGETGMPRTYHLESHTPPTLSFSPIPASNGSVDVLLIDSGASGAYLGIPDDFAWAVKWGALADLLGKDGPARDYARSLYCERRYRLGVAAALTRQVVTDVRVNGRPARFTTIDKLDSGVMGWQERASALAPAYAAPVGMNMLVLAYASSAPCSLEFRAVHNAPVPTLGAGTTPLQIGREFLDMVIGYAAHLAMFKIGGSEFAATSHLASTMFDAAAEFNAKLRDSVAFEEIKFSDAPQQATRRGIRRITGASVGGDQAQTNEGQP